MKIAVVYMHSPNLGDRVIGDTAMYIIRDILRRHPETPCEIDTVDMSAHRYKGRLAAMSKRQKRMRLIPLRKRGYRAAKDVLRSSAFSRRFPGAAQEGLRVLWRFTADSREYRRLEKDKLRGADLILFSGGGLIKYLRQDFHLFIDDITRYAEDHGVSVVFNAMGIEGYDAKNQECMLLKRALNRSCVRYISTRDDFRTLSECYIENPAITLRSVCDPAFWTAETYGVAWHGQGSRRVGLNVIRPAIFGDYADAVDRKRLLAFYVELIGMLSEQGYQVELFSNGHWDDTAYLKRIMKEPAVAEANAESFIPATQAELVERICGYERVLAARMHACIISIALGIPCASLVYNDKQVLFARDVGAEDSLITQAELSAGTAFDRLVRAESRVISPAYKQSVYDNLEEMIMRFGIDREKQ